MYQNRYRFFAGAFTNTNCSESHKRVRTLPHGLAHRTNRYVAMGLRTEGRYRVFLLFTLLPSGKFAAWSLTNNLAYGVTESNN